MAKRRREPETKEADWGFDVEPFNEEEMVLKEARGFRSALVTIGWSLVAAIVSFLVWNPLEDAEFAWELTLLVGLAVGLLLKWVLPLAKVPIAEFKRKDWFGTGMTFFFSWLAFLLLLANPPIHDGSAPAFQVQVTPRIQEVGGEVFVYVVVGDNKGVDWDTLQLSVSGPDGYQGPTFESADGRLSHRVWNATLDREGVYEVHGSVRDVEGNLANLDEHFRVVDDNEAVTVRLPDDSTFDDVDDKLIVRLSDCETEPCLKVWRVTAVFADGASVNLSYDRDDKAYVTSPRVEGESSWGGVGTANFSIVVQEHARFQHVLFSCNNGKCRLPIEAALVKGPYEVAVTDEFPVLDKADKPAKPRELRSQSGFDVAALGTAVLVALAMVRRKNQG